MQPFIENSIEHAFNESTQTGLIKVSFTTENGTLLYKIEDNGMGYKKSIQNTSNQNQSYKSRATEITFERIKAINKRQKKGIQFKLIDLNDVPGEHSGTRVEFGFPVKD